MIIRNGLAITIPVLFSSGLPDGDLTWRLMGTNGAQVAAGTVVLEDGDVSGLIPIDATSNLLPSGVLFGSRDLEWTYTSEGRIINGEERYSIEARCPFGASTSGVRAKLGVEVTDLPDNDISLIRAYVGFRDTATAVLLEAVSGDAKELAVRDAIEAQAALALIPTMAVRIAVSEDSGTNAYKRQAINWSEVADYLSGLVNDALVMVNPVFDATPTGALFILATPATDPITNVAYG